MTDKTPTTGIRYLEKIRLQRRIEKTLASLLDEAHRGIVKCIAFRVYYKDGTSEIKAVGGTIEEQNEALVRLEAKEVRMKTLNAELRVIVDEFFVHLSEEERRRVLDSPERIRHAFNTLTDDQRELLSPSSQKLFKEYLTFLEEVLLPIPD